MSRRIVLLICCCCVAVFGWSQDSRSAEAPSPPRPQYQSFKKEKKGLFSFLKRDERFLKQSMEEESRAFRKRMKRLNRRKIREQNKLDRQERKREGYFGHKKPPKKRPPGKQKYCKICKIKH